MKRWRRVLALCLAAWMCLSVVACKEDTGGGSGTGDQVITLTVWEDESNIEMLKTLADEFSSYYTQMYPFAPKVKIEFIPQTEQSAVEKMVTDAPAGNGPDIFAFVHDTLGTAVANGVIAENAYGEVIRATHTEAAVNAFTLDGVVYGFPITAESVTVMYDKSKVTAEELSSLENLKASGKKIAWSFSADNGDGYYPFGLMSDVNLFGADGTDATSLNLATDKAVKNLAAVVRDYKDVIVDAEPNTGFSLLKNGDVVGVVTSPYLWSSMQNDLGDNAAVAVLPTLNGEAQRPFSGYKGYGVSKYSKNPSVAQEFCNFLVNEENQYYRFVKKGYLPTIEGSERLDQAVADSATAAVFQASLDNSVTMPNILKMGSYWAPMQDAMTEIWNLTEATEDAVRQSLQKATTTILG